MGGHQMKLLCICPPRWLLISFSSQISPVVPSPEVILSSFMSFSGLMEALHCRCLWNRFSLSSSLCHHLPLHFWSFFLLSVVLSVLWAPSLSAAAFFILLTIGISGKFFNFFGNISFFCVRFLLLVPVSFFGVSLCKFSLLQFWFPTSESISVLRRKGTVKKDI